MKFIFNLIQSVVIGCALLFCCFLILLFYSKFDKTDTFFMENAQFSNYGLLKSINTKSYEPENLQERQYSVFVHRISKGKGTIFAFRRYSNGDVSAIDDEIYEKLTIWIPNKIKNLPTIVSLNDSLNVKVAYSIGGSAWPKRGCSGYLKSGELSLQNNGSRVEVRINGIMEAKGSEVFSSSCQNRSININFISSRKDFSELNTWLGLKGEHVYSETYRRIF